MPQVPRPSRRPREDRRRRRIVAAWPFAEATWGEVDPAVFAPHRGRLAALRRRRHGSRPPAGQLSRHHGDHRPGRRPRPIPRCPRSGTPSGGSRAGDDVVAAGGSRTWPHSRSSGRTTAGSSSPTTSTWPRPIGPPRGGGARAGRRHRGDRPHRGLRPHGPGQPDHVMVHEASLLVAGEQPGRSWFCYEDHGYKHIPGLLAWRVAKLLRAQPWPTPAIVPPRPDEERKRRAIFCYTSQIPPLENDQRSRPGSRATSPSSSGAWPRRPKVGKAWPIWCDGQPVPGRPSPRSSLKGGRTHRSHGRRLLRQRGLPGSGWLHAGTTR